MDGEQTVFLNLSRTISFKSIITVTISFMEDFVSHVDIPTTRLLID